MLITDQNQTTAKLLHDCGDDADWFRNSLEEKGIKPCIPKQKSRGKPVQYDKRKYKTRNRISIMFGRIKGWRLIAIRYDKCLIAFFWAICLAAAVMFWLGALSIDKIWKCYVLIISIIVILRGG